MEMPGKRQEGRRGNTAEGEVTPAGKNEEERKGRTEDGTCVERDPRLSRRQAGVVGVCGALCLEAGALGGLSPGDSLHEGSEHRDTPKSLTPPFCSLPCP